MSVTRLPKGISTAKKSNSVLWDFPDTDPTKVSTYWEDFHTYAAGDFTITLVNSSTPAIGDVEYGALVMTNTAGATDSIVLTKKGLSFGTALNEEFWFKYRVKVSDATKSQILVGVTNAATVPFTLTNLTDGYFFHKPAAATAIDFYCRKDATTGSTKVASIGNAADDTFLTLGAYYNGAGQLFYYINDVKLGHVNVTSANLPDAAITPIFAVINGEAVAKTMTVDYVMVSEKGSRT